MDVIVAWFYKSLITVITAAVLTVFTAGGVYAMTDAEIQTLFDEALADSEKGDLGRAIASYETILSARPTMDRVRLELALANFRALNFETALSLAQQVLNSPNTPASVKASVRAFLEEIGKHNTVHLFTPFLSLGYIHDDNVNVGPGADTIDLAGGTLTLAPGSTPISSSGIQINGGLAHRYLAPSTYSIAGDQAAMTWQSQASLFRNQYLGNARFNVSVLTARTGPSLLVARKWRAQLNAQADHISVGNDATALFIGATPTFTWFFGGRTSLTGSMQVQNRNYVGANQDRDATYLNAGLSLGHQFDYDHKPSMTFGAHAFSENAQTERRSNDGFSLNIGASFEPVENGTMFALFNWQKRDYDGPEPVFGVSRDEKERRFSIGGNYRLQTDNNIANDAVINLAWTQFDNNSNVPIFVYDRRQIVLSLSKSF